MKSNEPLSPSEFRKITTKDGTVPICDRLLNVLYSAHLYNLGKLKNGYIKEVYKPKWVCDEANYEEAMDILMQGSSLLKEAEKILYPNKKR